MKLNYFQYLFLVFGRKSYYLRMRMHVTCSRPTIIEHGARASSKRDVNNEKRYHRIIVVVVDGYFCAGSISISADVVVCTGALVCFASMSWKAGKGNFRWSEKWWWRRPQPRSVKPFILSHTWCVIPYRKGLDIIIYMYVDGARRHECGNACSKTESVTWFRIMMAKFARVHAFVFLKMWLNFFLRCDRKRPRF